MDDTNSTSVATHTETMTVLGVNIGLFSRETAVALLLERLAGRLLTKVAFANSNLLMQLHASGAGPRLLDDFLILNDGLALDLAAKFLHGRKFPDNLVGTDFVPLLLSRLPAGTRVYLLGAKPGVAEKAAAALQAQSAVTICGARHGYGVDEAVLTEIAAARPDVLIVAMGNPLQEKWIAAHAAETGATLALGVGALLDNLAQEVRRAPVWVRNLRSEWLFRLSQEPRRLMRRYTVEMSAFFLAVWRDRRRSKGTDGQAA
ncbi:MAG: WecB/TagA/CpsF family glycosyltransferase [Beijerinckiaceae bacterium]|nr:WecB/TagA/CpsF family glycosyltransferase [Beijerinckiaceae bacterium]